MSTLHCVESIRIRSYSGPSFPVFGLNTKRYSVSLRIQSECGKIRTIIGQNTDTFYAVLITIKTDTIMRFKNSSSKSTYIQLHSKPSHVESDHNSPE